MPSRFRGRRGTSGGDSAKGGRVRAHGSSARRIPSLRDPTGPAGALAAASSSRRRPRRSRAVGRGRNGGDSAGGGRVGAHGSSARRIPSVRDPTGLAGALAAPFSSPCRPRRSPAGGGGAEEIRRGEDACALISPPLAVSPPFATRPVSPARSPQPLRHGAGRAARRSAADERRRFGEGRTRARSRLLRSRYHLPSRPDRRRRRARRTPFVTTPPAPDGNRSRQASARVAVVRIGVGPAR
jgi:hypothetical protein